ncbi:M28 family peptidase [Pedobacter nyackensis]|uniref:M28 family peptidase n=1 Tax=Pedobacter nyackensis TaxID=475255 RepID=UPI002931EC5D|nr:M28 family peptidase [Pedobacter nyackensis]
MKNITTILLFALLSLPVFSQNNKISYLEQTVNNQNAYRHLSIIASDRFEGRYTGTKGAWLAANYIRNQFKYQGLKGPIYGKYFQSLGFVYDRRYISLKIGKNRMVAEKDFTMGESNCYLPKGIHLEQPSIFLAAYSFKTKGAEAYESKDLSGKIIMTLMDSNLLDFKKKIAYFKGKNVSGLIVVDKTLDQINDFSAKYRRGLRKPRSLEKSSKIYSDAGNLELPIIKMGTAAVNIILSSGNRSVHTIVEEVPYGLVPVLQEFKIPIKLDCYTQEKPLRAENVIGYLEGSDPVLKKEVLVISSHYDHIGGTKSEDGVDHIMNGADDDGSGTTGVLLLAEAFAKAKKAGKGPKRSILFVTFVGEEMGLLGSSYYSEHPVVPLENTIVNLNMDMIGRGEEKREGNNNYVYTVGAGLISSELDSISKKVNADNVGLKLEVGVEGNPRFYFTASDHYNFAKHGIPVIFYFNGTHNDYHRPSDEIDKIDFDALVKRVKLVYHTALELANRPNRLRIDRE